MTDNEARGARLRQARRAAGFEDAAEAARALGVKEPTYTAHENGNRGFRADSAAQYARKFKVSVEWLLYGRSAKEPDPTTGFGESDVEPIDMAEYKRLSELDNFESGFSSMKVNHGGEAFGIRSGAIILIDQRTPARDGDIVVATKYDEGENQSVTLVRRLIGNSLIASLFDPPEHIDDRTVVRGRIVRAIQEF